MNIGSVWHRWDLHYHTPSSYDYKNKSKTNEVLVQELLDDGVSGVAVTDHHIIDFERIKALNSIANGKIKFLRGIEITSELGGSESIHFIAIFPDSLAEDEIRDSFLVPLGITKEKIERDNTLYFKAISYELFFKCAKSLGALTSIHAGKKTNSIENIKNWCRTKQDFKQTLLERIDILETSKRSDFTDYTDIVFKDIGKICPIVVCSDYHSEYKYREYNASGSTPPTLKLRDATWIKSDLTFEGLKQIVFEPELRVRVQEPNPADEKYGIKLQSISIDKCKLFNPQEVTFNPDMIAIIGEKGSGKTALLDIVSYVLGDSRQDSTSFIQRAKNELKGAEATYKIYGNSAETVAFLKQLENLRCKYINPSKLTEFCEDENAMQSFIRSIILNDEILNEVSKIKQNELDIQSALLKIEALDREIAIKPSLQTQIITLQDNIKLTENNKPELPSADTSLTDKFSVLSNTIETKQHELETIKSMHGQTVWFNNNRESILQDSMESFRQSIFQQFKLPIPYEKFKILSKYDDETVQCLEEESVALNERKEKLTQELDVCIKEYDSIKTTIFKNVEAQKQYEQWLAYLSKLKQELQKLLDKATDLTKKEEERNNIFEQCIQYFIENIRCKKLLFNYYGELKSELAQQIGNEDKNKITFIPIKKIQTANVQAALESVLSFKSVNEESLKKSIETKYQKVLDKVLEADDEKIREHVITLINLFISNDNKNLYAKQIEPKIFKAGHGYIDLYKIAFTDFVDINYSIQFNSIPMEQLSSGQKGIVLMKLLLRLDKSTDPLLIDQPEDNLDNKSVYDQLVEEFKRIKQRRQLLIATHNPNLVVNTDAEQIIVAEYRKKEKTGYISYTAGSIEDKDVREKICRILEGGKDAFINRERRYDFTTNS